MANDSDLHNAPTPSMPAESEKRTFVVQTPIYSYVMQYKLGHILKAQYDHGGWQRSLPLQFNSTQVALADALGIQMSRSEESMTVASVERDFIESLALGPGARPQALRTLGAALHLFHLKYLCKEMDDAGTDTARRAEILVNMAEPLQRYRKTLYE